MEARQILGEAIKQMDSDFCFLETGEGERRLLFAAAPRKPGDQRAGLLLGAGLRPGGVTLDGVALANACLGAPPAEAAPDQALLVMHLGWRLANLALVRRGKLLFLRDITWGLDDLLEELAPRAALDPAAISAMRLADKPLDAETAGHLEPSATLFLGELAKTHAYFQKATADLPGTQFALCGPGLLVPGLAELVGERLAMKRLDWQPLSAGDLAPGDDRRRAAVSCALLKGLLLDDG
jgi:type IV pilus assembly protein PilM